MSEKIRVLFLAANPLDVLHNTRLDKEAREIEERIQQGTKRDSFELISHWAVRPSDLQKLLLRYQPHIVHFSGHGRENEGILLEDHDGNMKPVSKEALTALFRALKDNIRIVFLNACYSKRQIDAIQSSIDFVIVMNSTIDDSTSIVFSSYFYQSLAFGRSVKEAFELALNQLELEGLKPAGTPELLVQNGVDASKTYLLER